MTLTLSNKSTPLSITSSPPKYHIMNPLPLKPTRHDVYDFISPTAGTKNAAVGKAVLVTGAGSGIGQVRTHFPNGLISSTSSSTPTETTDMLQHTAIHFARAGATSIVLAGRNAKDLEESQVSIQAESPKCHVLCVPTDITEPEAVATLFQKAGKIDILINNAASAGTMGPLVATDVQNWWTAFVRCFPRFGTVEIQIASRLISYRTSTSEARTWSLASS